MIEREFGVGFAAAEVGLQVDDAVRARFAAQRVEHVADEALQCAGEVRALEEELGIAVFLRPFVGDGPAEVHGEERFGDGVLADVAVRGAGGAPGGKCVIGLYH